MIKLFLIVIIQFSDGRIDSLIIDDMTVDDCNHYVHILKKHIDSSKLLFVGCRLGDKL